MTIPTLTMLLGMMMMLAPMWQKPRRVDLSQITSVLQRAYPPVRVRVSDDSRAMKRELDKLDSTI